MTVFLDSFAHYNSLLQKWSSGGLVGFNTNPAFIRTGPQSLQVSTEAFATGAKVDFATRSSLTAGVAWYIANLQGAGIFQFNLGNSPSNILYDIAANSDGSITFKSNGGQVQATTIPGILSAGEFFYIEVQMEFANGGAYELRVDTVPVASGTIAFDPDITSPGADSFILTGSALTNVYYNDLYINDSTGSVNTSFNGAIQVFAIYPEANESPLDWTPLSGTNFSEVNQAPPPGDSAYVSAASPGDIDLYKYNVTGPVGGFSIKAIQHCMCARLDSAGGHTIASQVGGTTGPGPQVGSESVGSSYAFVIQPWDTNPETSDPWLPTDFATAFIGPNITS